MTGRSWLLAILCLIPAIAIGAALWQANVRRTVCVKGRATSPGFLGAFWVLLGASGCFWVLLGASGCFWVLVGSRFLMRGSGECAKLFHRGYELFLVGARRQKLGEKCTHFTVSSSAPPANQIKSKRKRNECSPCIATEGKLFDCPRRRRERGSELLLLRGGACQHGAWRLSDAEKSIAPHLEMTAECCYSSLPVIPPTVRVCEAQSERRSVN